MTANRDVERLLRELAPQVLGALTRRFRDFAAAEDALQEALLAAARQWPADGLPQNPRGWLIHVAQRRLTDEIRSAIARRARESEAHALAPDTVMPTLFGEPALDPDDTLVLLFMACHPALSEASQIALTLRAVGGLTTAGIAAAFLVPEATIGQRISRAKQAIVESGIPFEMPGAAERRDRLGAVLHILYLIFNEGYVTSAGALDRPDLAAEAIRLARKVHDLLPAHSEVEGLLALMLLTDARSAARSGPHGELIPLDEQDRTLWNAAQITEGIALVSAALPRGELGPYQVQAAIAAVHDEAGSANDTDWPQIRALYEVLMQLDGNPVIALNHAVAVAMTDGPDAALARIAALENEPRLNASHRLTAAKAHLLERAGRLHEAEPLYRQAAARTANTAERDFLLLKAAKLREPPAYMVGGNEIGSGAWLAGHGALFAMISATAFSQRALP